MQPKDISSYYDFIDVIGIGNFSKVWLAKHKILDKLVAIKIIKLNKQFSKDKFVNESQILAKVNSPNCVMIYDAHVAESRNLQYGLIITEYIDGKTLKDLDKNQITWIEKLKLCHQLINTVQTLHSDNIIHNDLSPKNIMITSQNQLKLIDFGSAKTKDRHMEGCAKHISGTIDWSCPEYIQNNTINDISNDIYAAGSLVYFILTSRKLYDDTDFKSKITLKKNYMPTSFDIYGCDLPDKPIYNYLKLMLCRRKYRLKNLSGILSHIHTLLVNEIFFSNIEQLKNDKS